MTKPHFSWQMLVTITIMTTFVLGMPVVAQAQRARAAEQQVLQAEKDRFAAMIKNDAAALDKLIAEEVTYTHGSARLVSKAEFIGELTSGAFKYLTITPEEKEWKVRVLGTVAIVNGAASMRVVDHGNDQTIKIRYTNVQVNRGGRWQMVAWQATRLP
jgi:hypothetical protein